VSNPPTNWFG